MPVPIMVSVEVELLIHSKVMVRVVLTVQLAAAQAILKTALSAKSPRKAFMMIRKRLDS